jgi:hypothetical protein
MKTGKELKINSFKDYNVVFGSVNNKHPKAVYINLSSWVQPKAEDEINYNRVIRDLNKKIKQTLFNQFEKVPDNDIIQERTIVDLDIRESGIRYGKRSFMSCEITIFLNTEIPVNSEIMKPRLTEIVDLLIDDVFKPNRSFSFNKKKN